KERKEHVMSQHRVALQRAQQGYGPPTGLTADELTAPKEATRQALTQLDAEIGPLVAAASSLAIDRWGLLFRAGSDKSHIARQVERYADVYTSRVGNLLHATPFDYLRSARISLPHDQGPGAPE